MLFAYEIAFSQDGSLLVFTSGMRGSTSFPTLAQTISLNGKEADWDKDKHLKDLTLARNGGRKTITSNLF